MKKAALTTLKIVAPIGLFAYLLWNVPPEDYRAFWEQPKQWPLLVAAQTLALTAISISFVRWFLLVRTFGIPFRLIEALRLGFLGYMLNFVSFGSVGGDLFKAILVARDKPSLRPEAVASVLLDRAIGLLGLIILAWVSLLAIGNEQLSEVMRAIRWGAGVVVIGSAAGLGLMLFAGEWFDSWIALFKKVPLLGDSLWRMAKAVRQLRNHKAMFCFLVVLAVCVHSLLAITIFLISSGIYVEHPTLQEHLVVVPPGMAAGALPLAPGGLGVQETALSQLFEQLPSLPDRFSGILVASVYRIVTIFICGIGIILYWLSHGREFEFARRKVGVDSQAADQNA